MVLLSCCEFVHDAICLTVCENNLRLLDEVGPSLLANIVTEYETALSLYLSCSKRESREWVFPDEKPSKMMRPGTFHRIRVMLTTLLDCLIYRGQL